jgi:hypothetical protein
MLRLMVAFISCYIKFSLKSEVLICCKAWYLYNLQPLGMCMLYIELNSFFNLAQRIWKKCQNWNYRVFNFIQLSSNLHSENLLKEYKMSRLGLEVLLTRKNWWRSQHWFVPMLCRLGLACSFILREFQS